MSHMVWHRWSRTASVQLDLADGPTPPPGAEIALRFILVTIAAPAHWALLIMVRLHGVWHGCLADGLKHASSSGRPAHWWQIIGIASVPAVPTRVLWIRWRTFMSLSRQMSGLVVSDSFSACITSPTFGIIGLVSASIVRCRMHGLSLT